MYGTPSRTAANRTNRETNDNNNIYHRDKMPGKKYREQERDGRQAVALFYRPTSKQSILSMFVIIEAAI